MTKISYIHSVPADEYAGRGRQVSLGNSGLYMPYLSLTKGEMRLQLLRQRMQMFANFYPESPEYAKAVKMIDSALLGGVHRGINFVGAIPDELQQVAAVIAQSVRQTQPAAGRIIGRESGVTGIGDLVDVQDSMQRRKDCMKAAQKIKNNKEATAAVQHCLALFEVERIYNDYLEKIGHHTLYNRINEAYPEIPARVFTRLVLHSAGIDGMANAVELDRDLVSDWAENGVLGKNAAIGAGLIGSVQSSFYLAPDPDAAYAAWVAFSRQRGDAVHGPHIGIAPVVVAAIVAAISAVVTAAFAFLSDIQKYKAYAMSEARGYGTDAYSAAKTDWPPGPKNPTTGEQESEMFKYLALGVGAWLVLSDD